MREWDVPLLDVTNGLTYDSTCRTLCRVFTESARPGEGHPADRVLLIPDATRSWTDPGQNVSSRERSTPISGSGGKASRRRLRPATGFPPARTTCSQSGIPWAWSAPNGWFGDGRDKWRVVSMHTPELRMARVAEAGGRIVRRRSRAPDLQYRTQLSRRQRAAPPEQAKSELGLYFNGQWTRALKVDPEIVFVTGWNEWIAQRFLKETGKAPKKMCGKPLQPGDTFFVDAFNHEFSRDIEPMKGGHREQLCYHATREFHPPLQRCACAAVSCNAGQAVAIDGRFDDRQSADPGIIPTRSGDRMKRDSSGTEGAAEELVDYATGRNDLAVAKVSRDEKNSCFYARTAAPHSAHRPELDAVSSSTRTRIRNPGWLGL